MLHRGYISTKMYIRNREKYHFDSFIFGSSHSCAHTSKDWKRYLHDDNEPFSYGSWSERILGIERKLEVIDKLNDTIKNAIIIIDGSTFKSSEDPLAGEHYLITGDTKAQFHYYYFKQFLNLKMMLTCIDYRIFKRQRKYMKHFQGMKPGDLDPINNDWYRDIIPEDTLTYYKNAMHRFYKRPEIQQCYPQKIEPFEVTILKKIKTIFDKHGTNYKLVIAPLYDQKKIHPEDLRVLTEIFGKNSIYDYSGINDITSNMYNYNEDVFHYRYKVGKRIYRDICSGSQSTNK